MVCRWSCVITFSTNVDDALSRLTQREKPKFRFPVEIALRIENCGVNGRFRLHFHSEWEV